MGGLFLLNSFPNLDPIKKYGYGCQATDFTILLGGSTRECTNSDFMRLFSIPWLVLCNGDPACHGDSSHYEGAGLRRIGCFFRCFGIRPAIKFSNIKDKCNNQTINCKNIKEVDWGEYPQNVVSEDVSIILEKKYIDNKLNKTGRKYITDSAPVNAYYTKFSERIHEEYEFNNKRYIRFVVESISEWDTYILSSGKKVNLNDIYWLHVEPIKWVVDEENDIAFTKKSVFSGVQYNEKKNNSNNYENSNIKMFLDKYFYKDIQQERIEKNIINIEGENYNNVTNMKEDKKDVVLKENKTNNSYVFKKKENDYGNWLAVQKEEVLLNYLCNGLVDSPDTSVARAKQMEGIEVFRELMLLQTANDMRVSDFERRYENSFSRCRSRFDEYSRVSLTSKERK